MRVQTQLLVEFDTDNPLGLSQACFALRKLVAEIDPGLTVYLQTIRMGNITEQPEPLPRELELTHNYLPDDVPGTISG